MKYSTILNCTIFTTFWLVASARSSSFLAETLPEQIDRAAAVARGTVLDGESYRDPEDGRIYTRTRFRIDEALKGTFPEAVQIIHRGGFVDGEGDFDGFAPRFETGGEYLIFLSRRTDGSLYSMNGSASAIRLDDSGNTAIVPKDIGAVDSRKNLLTQVRDYVRTHAVEGDDVTDQAAPATISTTANGLKAMESPPVSHVYGMIEDNGVAPRFLQPDRGEPIPYLIDADFLPDGITQQQALEAVEHALAAWTAVTSLQFKFEGITSFGMASPDVPAEDGKLRIQLHDFYNYITGPTTLGIGGRRYTSNLMSWASGGNVAGNEFHQTVKGYVVLKHTDAAMQDLSTFEEVLCHEIGHSLSMAHTSEDPNETDPTLLGSIMYYRAHRDGRGASLGEWDPPVIQQAYPVANTPPYSFDRVMDAISSPQPSGTPGINAIELRGFDLQEDGLTISLNNVSDNGNGTFSLNGNILKFEPAGYFGSNDSQRLDPAESFFYERVLVRFSDGVNASPPALVRVLGFLADTHPSNSDGIPDSWMVQYFGNLDPSAGPNRGANDDFDGDGYTNLQEYRMGSDPTDPDSNLQFSSISTTGIEWRAKPYELYEIQSSTDLDNWTTFRASVPPTDNGVITGFFDAAKPNQFFRVLKIQ